MSLASATLQPGVLAVSLENLAAPERSDPLFVIRGAPRNVESRQSAPRRETASVLLLGGIAAVIVGAALL